MYSVDTGDEPDEDVDVDGAGVELRDLLAADVDAFEPLGGMVMFAVALEGDVTMSLRLATAYGPVQDVVAKRYGSVVRVEGRERQGWNDVES